MKRTLFLALPIFSLLCGTKNAEAFTFSNLNRHGEGIGNLNFEFNNLFTMGMEDFARFNQAGKVWSPEQYLSGFLGHISAPSWCTILGYGMMETYDKFLVYGPYTPMPGKGAVSGTVTLSDINLSISSPTPGVPVDTEQTAFTIDLVNVIDGVVETIAKNDVKFKELNVHYKSYHYEIFGCSQGEGCDLSFHLPRQEEVAFGGPWGALEVRLFMPKENRASGKICVLNTTLLTMYNRP